MRKVKMEAGWRQLKPNELPICGDECRDHGSRYWRRNFLNHDTEAGSYLWSGMTWRRQIVPVDEVFIPLTQLPQALKGEKVDVITIPAAQTTNTGK